MTLHYIVIAMWKSTGNKVIIVIIIIIIIIIIITMMMISIDVTWLDWQIMMVSKTTGCDQLVDHDFDEF